MKFIGYERAVELVAGLREPARKIKMHDRDLANQLTRAATSIALNLAEGSGREMGDRLQLFRTALGSAKETKAALEVARAWGWISGEDTKMPLALLDQVLAICWRLTHPKGT